MFKIGDTIKIIKMEGEPSYKGKVGKITLIDDVGQIHGTWGGCALIPEVDSYSRVEICAICGQEIRGSEHNGQPLVDGKVCEECNIKEVIPYRIKLLNSLHK